LDNHAGERLQDIELIGTSTTSWEEAAKNAVERAAETLRELRVADRLRPNCERSTSTDGLLKSTLEL
jgi:hypothetical protein